MLTNNIQTKHVNFPGQIPAVFNKIARHTQTQPSSLSTFTLSLLLLLLTKTYQVVEMTIFTNSSISSLFNAALQNKECLCALMHTL